MMNDKELIVGRILAKIQLYRLMHTMCLSFQVTLRIKKAASKKLIHVSAATATAVEIESSVVIYPSLIQGLKVVRVLAYNPHHHNHLHHLHNHEYHDQNRNHFEQQHDDNNNDNDPMYQSTETHITQLVQLR